MTTSTLVRPYLYPVRDGMRAMAGQLPGVMPFGFVAGAAAAHTAAPLAGALASVIVYGGSAQLLISDLAARGGSLAAVLAGVLAIQLRLALYSAVLAPRWRSRALPAFLVIDPQFLIGQRGPALDWFRFHLAAGLTMFAGWNVAVLAGLFGGALLPAGVHLELVGPLYLLALAVDESRSRSAISGVLVGVAATLALPFALGPAPAIFLGVAAGLFVGRRR